MKIQKYQKCTSTSSMRLKVREKAKRSHYWDGESKYFNVTKSVWNSLMI